MYPSILGAVKVRSRGVKRADRPRACIGDDSAEGFSIGLCGHGEGKDGDPGFQPVPAFKA